MPHYVDRDKSGYIKLREGTNGFTCLVNRDAILDNESVLKPTCWDTEGSATVVPMVLRVGELLAQGKINCKNKGHRVPCFYRLSILCTHPRRGRCGDSAESAKLDEGEKLAVTIRDSLR